MALLMTESEDVGGELPHLLVVEVATTERRHRRRCLDRIGYARLDYLHDLFEAAVDV